MSRLLIVEDDPALSLGLADSFHLEGFEVTAARDGLAARELLFTRHFDLLLLDLMLPRLGGLQLLRELRERGLETPVLVLTALGEEGDRVLGLELGADDYLVKPFSLRELKARVRALLRREHRGRRPALPPPFRLGPARVDLGAFEIARGRHTFALSPTEARMLALLHAEANRVVSRARFLDEIWAGNECVGPRTVDTHILNLRRKLEPDPRRPARLLTVHGAGYKLVLDP